MPDSVSTVPAVTPGHQTTEYKLARIASYASLLCVLIGALLGSLSPDLQASRPVAITLMVIGAVTKILTTLGYMNSRATVKAAAQESGNSEVMQALLALLKQTVADVAPAAPVAPVPAPAAVPEPAAPAPTA